MNELYSKLLKNTHKKYLKTKGEYPFVNFHVVAVCEDQTSLHDDINEYSTEQILNTYIDKIHSVKVEVKTKTEEYKIHTMNFVVTIEYYD